MRGRETVRWIGRLGLAVVVLAGCGRRERRAGDRPSGSTAAPGAPAKTAPRWAGVQPPAEGQVLALQADGARLLTDVEARAAGLLIVDLGDGWAPFIFSESEAVPPAADGSGKPSGDQAADPSAQPRADGSGKPSGDLAAQPAADAGREPEAPKPNAYRKTFVDLANDRVDPEELFLAGGATRAIDMSPEAEAQREREARDRRAGKRKPEPKPAPRKRSEPVRNFLEVYGIPPTLSVLLRRVEHDAAAPCFAALDTPGLRAFSGTVTYQNVRQAKRDHDEVLGDAAWLAARLQQVGDAGAPAPVFGPPLPDAGAVAWADLGLSPAPPERIHRLRANAQDAARLERLVRGQVRLRAIRAAQARLVCEGLLTSKDRYVAGMFDLPTHEALARWERKNDIFGWGFLGEETHVWLQRPALDLHFETWKRILTERVADAAGILEDGSAGRAARYRGPDGKPTPVPNVIADHVSALLAALEIATPADMTTFLRTFGRKALRHLRVAFAPPALPPYYAAHMELDVEIDRGDIWYDFPFTAQGQPIEQERKRYPSLTVLTTWNGQRIPLARWRTTIGSWRSELHPDGEIYYKYKSSDVGPRIWKQIVAAPVWVPPDSTPAQDLLTKKIFDLRVGPVDVVNTEVMGPGFQSAYGLVMAIHHKVTASGGLFDNQIRTHGSVDYTSIARRFSHGCHRLVNARAVRLFGFVLRHRSHLRHGDSALGIKKLFTVAGRRFGYELSTRGYYYELTPPLPVNVLEGRVLGATKKPITTYVRKPGVIYQASSRSTAPTTAAGAPAAPGTGTAGEGVETAPVFGP